jgi:hypothetical protein
MPNEFGGNSSSNRELAFSLQFNVADKPEELLDFTRYFQSAKAEVSDMSAYHVVIELFDGESSDLENTLVLAGQDSRLQLSFGWREDNNPTINLTVASFEPQFLPNGFAVSIDCVIVSAYESGTNKLPANAFTFPGYKYTASEIVAQIAAKTIAVPTSSSTGTNPGRASLITKATLKSEWKNPVIEESAGILETDLATALGDTTCGFIVRKIMPLAVNRDGVPFDFYFDHYGTMHFHTKGYDASNGNAEHIIAIYEYARDTAGDVFEFEPRYSGVAAAMLGGSNAVFKSVNARDGSTTTTSTTPANNGVNSDNVALQADAKNIMKVSDGTQSYTKLPDRSPGDANLRAQAIYGYLRNAFITATLTVLGNWALKIGVLVKVNYKRRDGTNHPMGGVFRVSGVAHTIDSSRGFMTSCSLFRAGFGEQLPGLSTIEGVTQALADSSTSPTDDSTTFTKTISPS